MQVSQRLTRGSPFTSRPQKAQLVVRCSAEKQQASRRDALLAAGSFVLASPLAFAVAPASAEPLKTTDLPVKSLSSFQKQDERDAFRITAQNAIKQVLTKEDCNAAVRMALRCASTYDPVTKKGGFDGSIMINPDELARPENASLRPFAEKLQRAKDAVDAAVAPSGSGPISYADMIVLAVKVTSELKWAQAKIDLGNGKLGDALRNPWPVVLGRVDSTEIGPNSLPAAGAPVEEIKASLRKMGTKPDAGTGIFDPKPLLWEKPGFLMWCAAAEDEAAEEARLAAADPAYAEIKRTYDRSRETVSRTDYEIDFFTIFNKVSLLGAKLNPDAYLYPIKVFKMV